MLTLNVVWFTFWHILGLIEHVAVDVNQVKNITKNTNDKMKEGFDKVEGKIFNVRFGLTRLI